MSASPAGDITPTELAKLCNTDPKTMRRFMRSLTAERVGRGGRWEIARSDVDMIVRAFNARSTSRSARFDASALRSASEDSDA